MKKVLFIGPLPPPYNGQSIAFSYLKELSFENIEVEFCNTQRSILPFFNYLFSWVILPLRIILSNYHLIYFTGARTIWGFIRQIPLFLSALIKKIPLINHLHGADFKNFYDRSNVMQPLIRFCYTHIDSSVVLVESMKREFIDFPQMHIEVVPNAFNADFENLKITFPKQNNILYLSNLMASKGIIYFLKASEHLLKSDKDLTITIAGGFVSDHLKKAHQIKQDFYSLFKPLKKKFKNRIEFLGVVVGEQKVKLLLKSSIFILPSFYPTEAFPISIIEAMRTGNAIITTKHNYLQEIIDHRNGRLISIQSVNEIVKAVNDLLKEKNLLRQIQDYNIQISSKENTMTNYLAAIKRIINEVV